MQLTFPDKRFAFKVIDEQSNETIGHAEIYLAKADISHLCRILIGNKEYRGKGLGQQIVRQLTDYSFDKLNSQIVELNVYDWNISAIQCYEKVGFKINPDCSTTTELNGNIWTANNMIIKKEERSDTELQPNA